MNGLSATLVIAYRDVLKFLRDPMRIVSTFIFPIIFIVALGGGLQGSLGSKLGFNYLTFTFTGILAQTFFQSASMGVISLVDDRQSDFAQEMFVAPVSRYLIIFGKILGETMVALVQGVGLMIFALILHISFTWTGLVAMLPVSFLLCFMGGAFGVLVLSTLPSQQSAQQAFAFMMFPQLFLAGVVAPLKGLPGWVNVLTFIMPLRYGVDLMRNAFYAGSAQNPNVVLLAPAWNLLIVLGLFALFLFLGTSRFVRSERNR